MQDNPAQDTDVANLESSIDLNELQQLNIGPSWSDPKYSGPAKAEQKSASVITKSRAQRRPARGSSVMPKNRSGRRPKPVDYKRATPSRSAAPFKPTVDVFFYPENEPFRALIRALKETARTYELFQITRLILQKPGCFVVEVRSKAIEDEQSASIFTAIPDGVPFETEDDACKYVLKHHLDAFFNIETVDVEAPKGNFPLISRCMITGELLAPPNYHLYKQILAEHHTSRLAHISIEKFKAKIETVNDSEAVNQWMEKMKVQTRYTYKLSSDGTPVEFDNAGSARDYMLTHCKGEIIISGSTARFPGALLAKLPEGNIKRSVFAVLEEQRRFPLESSNHLRRRLRHMNFTVYKRGAKGVTYLCAIKRKFREPGQLFSDSVQSLISFIEEHPKIPVSRLSGDFLGINEPEGDKKEMEGNEDKTESNIDVAESEEVATDSGKDGAGYTGALSAEDEARLNQMRQDLHWLIAEGYVVEYWNGALFAAAPRPAASGQERKKRRSSRKVSRDKPEISVSEESVPGSDESIKADQFDSDQEPKSPVST